MYSNLTMPNTKGSHRCAPRLGSWSVALMVAIQGETLNKRLDPYLRGFGISVFPNKIKSEGKTIRSYRACI